jgi:hypothetical protein
MGNRWCPGLSVRRVRPEPSAFMTYTSPLPPHPGCHRPRRLAGGGTPAARVLGPCTRPSAAVRSGPRAGADPRDGSASDHQPSGRKGKRQSYRYDSSLRGDSEEAPGIVYCNTLPALCTPRPPGSASTAMTLTEDDDSQPVDSGPLSSSPAHDDSEPGREELPSGEGLPAC